LPPAIGAGDLQHPASAAGAEVGDVGAGYLAEAGAGEEQDGGQGCGAGALGAGRGVGRVDEREGLALGEGGAGRGVRAGAGPGDAGGGLAVMCARRASQAYQLEMAASLRAALAGDSPAASSCLAYWATCSAVTPVTGCTLCCWHQVSHDGARPGRCCGVMPMSRA